MVCKNTWSHGSFVWPRTKTGKLKKLTTDQKAQLRRAKLRCREKLGVTKPRSKKTKKSKPKKKCKGSTCGGAPSASELRRALKLLKGKY